MGRTLDNAMLNVQQKDVAESKSSICPDDVTISDCPQLA